MKKKRFALLRSVSSMLGRTKGIASEALPWILIAIAVLAIVLIAIFVLKRGGIDIIEKIKALFTGG
jgi:hypothetical protein